MAEKKVPINFIFRGIDELTGPLKSVNSKLSKLGGPVRNLQGQFNAFGKLSGINQLGTSLSGLASSTAKLGVGLVATTAAAYYAMDRLVGATVKQNAAMFDNAKKTGFSVEQLQLWHYAAEQSGTSVEALDSSLVKFSKVLSETRRGKGALVELLGSDSEFVSKIKGIKGTEAAYEFFLKTLGKIPDEANQVAFATAGMGRAGAEQIQLAEEAAKGNLKTLFETRAAMGLIGKEQAEAFDTVDDTFNKISNQLSVLKTNVVVQLLPAIQRISDTFSKWVTDNQPQIIAFASQIAEKLPGTLEAIGFAVQSLNNFFGGFANILKIVAAVIGAQLLISLSGLIGAIYALGVALVTTPIGWAILGITALVGIFWGLYKIIGYVSTKIHSAFSGLGTWLSSFGVIGEKLVGIFSFIGDTINKVGSSKLPGFTNFGSSGSMAPALATGLATGPQGGTTNTSEATLKINFENQPKGMRFDIQNPDKVPLDVYSGFSNMG